MDKKRELLKAVLLLPGTAVLVIPGIILAATRPVRWLWGKTFPESMFVVAVAFFLACIGMAVALWTVMLFYHRGDGTPAPWAPPTRLIVTGPYAVVRNPMITAVVAVLLAEVLVFGSLGVLAWTAIFWALNTVYFKFIEEPGLKRRFGEEYDEYAANVARWAPRLDPWEPPQKSA